MIEKISIKNYKSVSELDLNLGRVTVLIGENGCGKSNILESIALLSAAMDDKLDNEFLGPRGIRVTEPAFMRSAFSNPVENAPIHISYSHAGQDFHYILENDNSPYGKWTRKIEIADQNGYREYIFEQVTETVRKEKERNPAFGELPKDDEVLSLITTSIHKLFDDTGTKTDDNIKDRFKQFLIYSPENSALRKFEKEGQIEPLGIYGEGLFKLLKVFKSKHKLDIIKEHLSVIEWFEDLDIPENLMQGEFTLQIKDKYIDESLFNQKNANEGFLFLLFYISLFVSDDTPKFFAIDNIEASLNPRLCTELIKKIVELAKQYDKQVILTTHNPAILDGLNLADPQQKLLVVSRSKKGHTRVSEIENPKVKEGEKSVKLSRAFTTGMLGGLPKHF